MRAQSHRARRKASFGFGATPPPINFLDTFRGLNQVLFGFANATGVTVVDDFWDAGSKRDYLESTQNYATLTWREDAGDGRGAPADAEFRGLEDSNLRRKA